MSTRIQEFDIWRPGYGASKVYVYLPGTTTLAAIYTNESLTEVADNPQTLLSKSAPDGTSYGKFETPLYAANSYYLSIDGIENTGIIRPPIATLDGEDVGGALLSPNGSAHETSLEDFVSLTVNAALYGELVEGASGVPATNTATIQAAIAALTNGGYVLIPAGTYNVNSLNVPEGVVVCGYGREATTLKSVLGDVSFNLVGDRSGFKDITLDGNSLSTGSIGIKSVGNDETVFSSVMVRRFETGIHFLGGKGHIWQDFSIENVETAGKLHGDTNAGGGGNGGQFSDLMWIGGLVSVATVAGLSLAYEDAVCHNLSFTSVGFEDCTEYAVDILGAQSVFFNECWWDGNTKNIRIQDDDPIVGVINNIVVNVSFNGGRFKGGTFLMTDTAENVRLTRVKIEDVDFTLSTPVLNFLVLEDCYEDSLVTIAGEPAKLLRAITNNTGASFGLTSTNVATKAWGINLEPGQVAYMDAKIVAKGRNNADRAIYHILCGAFRAGSTLAYDSQTANFLVGGILTGQSSGATARIVADTDSGATGTLTLTDIKGVFLDNEIIRDDQGSPGSATVNGSLSSSNASLDGVGNVSARTAYETDTDFAAAFVANGTEIELRVTGDTSKTVEWNVHVDVVTT